MEKKKRTIIVYIAAVILVIIGLLAGTSKLNSIKHHFAKEGTVLFMYKGKFMPFGSAKAEGFVPIELGNLDCKPLSAKSFSSREAAMEGLYSFFVDLAIGEYSNGGATNLARADELINLADGVVTEKMRASGFVDKMALKVAMTKIEAAEKYLARVYEDAAPVLKKALEDYPEQKSIHEQLYKLVKIKTLLPQTSETEDVTEPASAGL
ncbi:MAG: hypothetical protein H8E17_03880 [Deltaproteobacteria bacterium]|nr:hypothetical protein [Deltaproteobacteria bacterium]